MMLTINELAVKYNISPAVVRSRLSRSNIKGKLIHCILSYDELKVDKLFKEKYIPDSDLISIQELSKLFRISRIIVRERLIQNKLQITIKNRNAFVDKKLSVEILSALYPKYELSDDDITVKELSVILQMHKDLIRDRLIKLKIEPTKVIKSTFYYSKSLVLDLLREMPVKSKKIKKIKTPKLTEYDMAVYQGEPAENINPLLRQVITKGFLSL